MPWKSDRLAVYSRQKQIINGTAYSRYTGYARQYFIVCGMVHAAVHLPVRSHTGWICVKTGFWQGKAVKGVSGSRKKNGCAGGCFLLPFLIHDTSIFLAARGKAAQMLTLTELKGMADIPAPGQKAPTAKELRASAALVAEHTLRGGARISAYKSGYAIYSVCGASTVFCLHSCGGYCYDAGENPCNIDSRLFEEEAWYLRLILEGEDRLCHIRESKEQDWNVSYSIVSEEWRALDSGEESVLERIVREEAVEGLLSALSDRQRLAVRRFYLEQKTEQQIADEFGITASGVSRILARSVNRMRQGGNTALSGRPA